MRPLTIMLALVSLLILPGFSALEPASEASARPTEQSIEALLRDALAREEVALPSLLPFKSARMMEFGLVTLERVTSSRWHAETEMVFDFGPPPPAVLGFERLRRGQYRLVLERVGEVWRLKRFTPMGRVHPLPAGN